MTSLSDSLCSHLTPDTTADTGMSRLAGAIADWISGGNLVYKGLFTGVMPETGVPVIAETANLISPGALVATFTAAITVIKNGLGEFITFDQVFDTLYDSIKTSCIIGLGDVTPTPLFPAFPSLERTVLQQEVLKAAVILEQDKIQAIAKNESLGKEEKKARIKEINNGLQKVTMDALGDALLADLVAGSTPTVPGTHITTAVGTTTGSATTSA